MFPVEHILWSVLCGTYSVECIICGTYSIENTWEQKSTHLWCAMVSIECVLFITFSTENIDNTFYREHMEQKSTHLCYAAVSIEYVLYSLGSRLCVRVIHMYA